MELSDQLHAPAALSQGKSPWYPLDRRLGGPQSRSGRGGLEKNSHHPQSYELLLLSGIDILLLTTGYEQCFQHRHGPPSITKRHHQQEVNVSFLFARVSTI